MEWYRKGADVAWETPTQCATPKPAAPVKGTTADVAVEARARFATVEPAASEKGTIAARQLPAVTPASIAASSTGTQTNPKPRFSLEVALPLEVLEAISGFHDRKTLCIARLVSKTFCAAASAHVSSLTLRSTSQRVPRQRFPHLDRVSVHHSGEEVDPELRELITAVTIRDCQDCPMEETLSKLASMPKLQTLNLGWYSCGESDIEGTAGLVCHRAVPVKIPLSFDKAGIATSWTSSVSAPSEANVSWLQQATTLRNLQELSIVDAPLLAPLIGDLTALTGLTWSYSCHKYSGNWAPPEGFIAPLTRLTMLRSLRLGYPLSDTDVEIACSLGSGSLVSLDLGASSFHLDPSADCGSFVTRQIALTRLGVDGQLCNMEHIGALRLELLQSLKLWRLTSVDAEGLAALQNATRLTELSIRFSWLDEGPLPDLLLSQTLAGLTQLRSLMLDRGGRCYKLRDPSKLLDYDVALRPLTGLTELAICNGGLDNEDLLVLLVLTRLRVLDLCRSCLTDDAVPELAGLTNLEKLRLGKCGVTSLESVTDVLNPLRLARSWPPMVARL